MSEFQYLNNIKESLVFSVRQRNNYRSVRTVSFHRSNIYRKLEIHSIQELLAKRDAVVQYSAVSPAEQEPVRTAAFLYISKELKRLIPLGIPLFIVCLLFVWKFFVKPLNTPGTFASALKPLVLTLNDNEPWGYTIFYPFLSNNTKINKDDVYTISYSFVSNVDIDVLLVFFLDKADKEGEFNVKLSSDAHIKSKVKANTEYSGVTTIIAVKTSSSTDPNANLLVIDSIFYTGNQPTLTFSKFEIVKNN